MKIGEYITTQRRDLQQLEIAANGKQHDLGPGTLVQLLEGLLRAVDVDQQVVQELGDSQDSTRHAVFLAKRTDQLQSVRKHLVDALDAAGNTELEI